MSFGFDPSIILGAKQYTGPDANETMKTLSDIAYSRVRQQQAQAQLAELARQQGEARTLSDLARQYADTPDQLPTALLRAGLPNQSYAAQDQLVQTAGRNAQTQQLLAAVKEKGMSILRNRAAAIKSPDEYNQFISGIPQEARASLGLPDQYNEGALKSFVAEGVPAERRAELDQKDRHDKLLAGEKVTNTGTGQRIGFNPDTGEWDNDIGNPKPIVPKTGGKTGDEKLDKSLADLKKDIDGSMGRTGEFGKNQGRMNRADRLLNIANVTPDGNFDKRQMEELAIGSAAILSDSGSPAQSTVHALVPSSLEGDAAKLKEWMTGDPQGLEQQKFARKLLDTVKNERSTITQQMRNAVAGRLTTHIGLYREHPQEFMNTLRAYKTIMPEELDENLQLKTPGDGPSGAGGDAHPAGWDANAEKRLQELEARAAARKKTASK